MSIELFDGYRIEMMEADAFFELEKPLSKGMFDHTISFNARDTLHEEEQERVLKLLENFDKTINIFLGLFKGDEFVGWSWGWQCKADEFYMCNSAVLPAHRRKGLYTALMQEMMKEVKRLGFQVIKSRHTTVNNAVLIPKLKAGFVITGMEVSDMFGTLVNLSYFINPVRRKAIDYRVGEQKADEELQQYLS